MSTATLSPPTANDPVAAEFPDASELKLYVKRPDGTNFIRQWRPGDTTLYRVIFRRSGKETIISEYGNENEANEAAEWLGPCASVETVQRDGAVPNGITIESEKRDDLTLFALIHEGNCRRYPDGIKTITQIVHGRKSAERLLAFDRSLLSPGMTARIEPIEWRLAVAK